MVEAQDEDPECPTKTGLAVRCELDDAKYPKGIAVSDQQIEALAITRAEFHGEWNYTIKPQNDSKLSVIS